METAFVTAVPGTQDYFLAINAAQAYKRRYGQFPGTQETVKVSNFKMTYNR
jgi:hypothetical protein